MLTTKRYSVGIFNGPLQGTPSLHLRLSAKEKAVLLAGSDLMLRGSAPNIFFGWRLTVVVLEPILRVTEESSFELKGAVIKRGDIGNLPKRYFPKP